MSLFKKNTEYLLNNYLCEHWESKYLYNFEICNIHIIDWLLLVLEIMCCILCTYVMNKLVLLLICKFIFLESLAVRFYNHFNLIWKYSWHKLKAIEALQILDTNSQSTPCKNLQLKYTHLSLSPSANFTCWKFIYYLFLILFLVVND